MLPIRLEIKNFLPYRVPDPLLFDGIQMACLTGANGAGKSSILDAITWVLWGEARAKREDDPDSSRPDRDEHPIGFYAGRLQISRLAAARASGKSGRSELTLFGQNPQGGWTSINEGSIRETQRKINEILRLTHETFIHSAYLQQARPTPSPRERRRAQTNFVRHPRPSRLGNL